MQSLEVSELRVAGDNGGDDEDPSTCGRGWASLPWPARRKTCPGDSRGPRPSRRLRGRGGTRKDCTIDGRSYRPGSSDQSPGAGHTQAPQLRQWFGWRRGSARLLSPTLVTHFSHAPPEIRAPEPCAQSPLSCSSFSLSSAPRSAPSSPRRDAFRRCALTETACAAHHADRRGASGHGYHWLVLCDVCHRARASLDRFYLVTSRRFLSLATSITYTCFTYTQVSVERLVRDKKVMCRENDSVPSLMRCAAFLLMSAAHARTLQPDDIEGTVGALVPLLVAQKTSVYYVIFTNGDKGCGASFCQNWYLPKRG